MLNVAAYHFVPIGQPDALAASVRASAGDAHLLGTVIVAPEGINLFLAGPDAALHGWMDILRADPRFAPMHVKYSDSERQPFKKLLVKVKPEIISFRRFGIDPGRARAPSVAPGKLAEWIAQGSDDAGREVVLLLPATRRRSPTALSSARSRCRSASSRNSRRRSKATARRCAARR